MGAASLVFDLFGNDVSASKAMRNVVKEAESTSGGLAKAFKTASTGVVVAGAAAVVESVHMAAGFQTQMLRLVTAAGESKGNLKMVSDGVLEIARSTGTGTDKLAAGMYMIESAGFHGGKGLDVLKAAAQGAKIEGADMGVTGNALTTVLNDMHAPAEQAANVMSQMVAAVGQGKMTMDDFAGSIHSVLPNAAALGISFPQVAGALAEMTSQGISADQAAQNLNHAIVRLGAPTASMTAAMALYNVDAKDVAQNIGKNGLTGTFETLAHAVMVKMGPAGLTLISSFNQSKAAAADVQIMLKSMPADVKALADSYMNGTATMADWKAGVKALPADQAMLATQFKTTADRARGFNDKLKAGGQAAETFSGAMKSMTGDQTGLQVALHLTTDGQANFADKVKVIGAASVDAKGNVQDWSIKQSTLAVQTSIMNESLKTTAISIGTKFIPGVTSAVTWTTKHQGAVQILVGGLLALAVAVKTVTTVMKIAATTQKVLTAMSSGFTTLRLQAMFAGDAVRGFGSSIASAASTAGNFIKTLASMALGYAKAGLAATATALKTVAVAVAEGITTAATAVWTAAQWLLDVALNANPISLIVIGIAALIAGLVLAYNKVGWFRDLVNAAFHLIAEVVGAVVDWIKTHWQLMLVILTGPIGLAVLLIKKYWNDITDAVGAVVGWIKSHWKLLLEILTGPIGIAVGFIAGHWQSIKNGFTAVKDWIGQKVNDIVGFFTGIGGKIARVASGMWDGIKDAFRGAINWIIGAWDSLHFSIHIPKIHIPGVLDAGGQDIGFGVPQIPRLALGGIIPATPGGRLVRVAEAGRAEAIIPLNGRMRAMGDGGGTTINLSMPLLYGNADTAAREIIAALERQSAQGVRINIKTGR